MQICQIPTASASAVDNMAMDAAMLAFGLTTSQAVWRIYGWTEPAVTFGYSQQWDWIQQQLGGFAGACVRRLTGGGIVDHRHDLTYCLTLPPAHPNHRQPATGLYRELHQLIADILLDLGHQARLAPCPGPCRGDAPAAASGVCFRAPEPYDVVHAASGAKLAGAAMKRGRSGLLIQGSLSLQALPGLSRGEFSDLFGRELACWLGLQPLTFTGCLPEAALQAERTRFRSRAWNLKR